MSCSTDRGDGSPARLARDSVGFGHILFFVVAAAAPLTAVVGASPAAIAFGNGPGVPGAFILSGCLYLLFSVGFTAMSRHIPGGGAFYRYITRGLGKPAGFGAALMVLTAYNSMQTAIYALLGVFAQSALGPLGIGLPWWAYSLGALVLVTLLGRLRIGFSGGLLGACMTAEALILVLLDLGIVLHGGGPEGMDATALRPATVFAPGLGAALVFVVGSYTGFEATAIFAEEARDARRTVPRATFAAVLLITVLYAASTWAITAYYGPTHIKDVAHSAADTMFFTAADAVLGHWASVTMNVLLIISLFACVLSFHSTISRYYFALGREGTWPRILGTTDPVHQAPRAAGLLQSVVVAALLLAFVASRQDPYAIIFAWMSVLAVLGILAVQLLVSLAVVVFFRRSGGEGAWTGAVAPLLSSLGLGIAIALVIDNIALMAGSDSLVVRLFPPLMALVGLGGGLYAWSLRRRDPARYAALGQSYE